MFDGDAEQLFDGWKLLENDAEAPDS